MDFGLVTHQVVKLGGVILAAGDFFEAKEAVIKRLNDGREVKSRLVEFRRDGRKSKMHVLEIDKQKSNR